MARRSGSPLPRFNPRPAPLREKSFHAEVIFGPKTGSRECRGQVFPRLLLPGKGRREVLWKSVRYARKNKKASTGARRARRYFFARRRGAVLKSVSQGWRSARAAGCSSRSIWNPARCIGSVPSAKRNRGFPSLSASSANIGSTARPVGTRCHPPAC